MIISNQIPTYLGWAYQAYRAGSPQTMRKHALDKTWVSYLVAWVYVLCACPSALLFHAVVERILDLRKMQEANEVACARALRQHYLTSFPAASFRVRQHDCLTLADSWAGLCRLQPGSAREHKLRSHGIVTSLKSISATCGKISRHFFKRWNPSHHPAWIRYGCKVRSFQICLWSLSLTSLSSTARMP